VSGMGLAVFVSAVIGLLLSSVVVVEWLYRNR